VAPPAARQRKPAGVGERIEDLPSGGATAHRGAIRALVEIKTCLLAGHDVDAVDEPVLEAGHAIGERTVRQSRAGRQAFELAHVDVRALVDTRCTCRRGERRDDRLAPSLPARRRELQHDRVRIAIGNHAGETVGLAVDEPAPRVIVIQHRCACRDCARDAAGEKLGVDALARIERPDTRTDLRGRGIGRLCHECAVRGQHGYRVSRFQRLVGGRDRAREDPGVALPQRFLAPRLEPQHGIGISQARHQRRGPPQT
jgi:hypothetical protein